MNYRISITIDADSADQAKTIANALQEYSVKLGGTTLMKLLSLLQKNPQYLKMAKML